MFKVNDKNTRTTDLLVKFSDTVTIKTYILKLHKLFFSHVPLTSRCIEAQFLWFNKDARSSNKPFHFKDFSRKKTALLINSSQSVDHKN